MHYNYLYIPVSLASYLAIWLVVLQPVSLYDAPSCEFIFIFTLDVRLNQVTYFGKYYENRSYLWMEALRVHIT